MKLISIENIQISAEIDDSDFELVSQYKWYLHNNNYAITRNGMLMHILISGKHGMDHRDRNGLNNQRNNLRECSKSQNGANSRKKSSGKSSKFKGVYKHITRYKDSTYIGWAAEITRCQVKKHLGYFKTEIEAAKAYNIAAIKIFGEFARINEI